MRLDWDHSGVDREYRFAGSIPDTEIAVALNPKDVLNEFRHEIVRQLAAEVMKSLGPAVDEALAKLRMDSQGDHPEVDNFRDQFLNTDAP